MKLQRYDIRWQSDQYVLAQSSNGEWCRSAEAARLEASHAELLEAAKAAEAALRNYDIAGEFGWGSCRTPSQMEEQCAWSEEVYILRAAIAKAERSEDEPITDDEGAL